LTKCPASTIFVGLQKKKYEVQGVQSQLVRWIPLDPYNQYYSPYLGMGNNPINSVDPDGGWTDWSKKRYRYLKKIRRQKAREEKRNLPKVDYGEEVEAYAMATSYNNMFMTPAPGEPEDLSRTSDEPSHYLYTREEQQEQEYIAGRKALQQKMFSGMRKGVTQADEQVGQNTFGVNESKENMTMQNSNQAGNTGCKKDREGLLRAFVAYITYKAFEDAEFDFAMDAFENKWKTDYTYEYNPSSERYEPVDLHQLSRSNISLDLGSYIDPERKIKEGTKLGTSNVFFYYPGNGHTNITGLTISDGLAVAYGAGGNGIPTGPTLILQTSNTDRAFMIFDTKAERDMFYNGVRNKAYRKRYNDLMQTIEE